MVKRPGSDPKHEGAHSDTGEVRSENTTMAVIPFESLACPLDQLPLQHRPGGWQCASGHCFDRAKQGYTHLLPVQQKRSRDPGDSKAMVAARRRFLASGHYRPIADAISQCLLAKAVRSRPSLRCLDAGCGEGYYLTALADTLHQSPKSPRTLELMGLDISKWAVLAAAKRDKRPTWVVGSNAHLPVESETLDTVLNVFGFPVYSEFARVLRPGGQVISVDPGPDHLKELRELIYPQLKPAKARPLGSPEHFQRTSCDTVHYGLTLNSAETIADLLAMTPHYYRADAQGRARANALVTIELTIDVRLTVYTRQPSEEKSSMEV